MLDRCIARDALRHRLHLIHGARLRLTSNGVRRLIVEPWSISRFASTQLSSRVHHPAPPHSQRPIKKAPSPETEPLSETVTNVDRSLSAQLDWAKEQPTDALYTQLASFAEAGYTPSVHQLVRYLIAHRNEKPNVLLYSALVLANANHETGSAFHVKALLQEMTDQCIPFDARICHNVLKVLSVHLDYLLRNDVLEYMRRRWFTLSREGQHYVVAGQLREGQLHLALERMRAMRDQGVQIQGWLEEMAFYALLDGGEIDQALAHVRSRWERGERDISKTVWAQLLDVGSAAFHYPAVLYVWTRQVNLGFLNPSDGVCLNALVAAADVGDVKLATDVFRLMGQRATTFLPAHYEALQRTYLNASQPDLSAALNVVVLMAASNLAPASSDTRPLFEHLRLHPDDVQFTLDLLGDLARQGQKVPIALLNVAIESLVDRHDYETALEVYERLDTFRAAEGKPVSRRRFADLETYRILLGGARLADPVDVDQARALAVDMAANGIQPDALCYDRLISTCCLAKDFEHALEFCEDMTSAGLRLRAETKALIIGVLASSDGDASTRQLTSLLKT